jgi:uncharacterized RDD family membrane protein YckC
MSTSTQETLRIATPEGVSLELPLAGVGSRFVAALLDMMLQLFALVVLGFAVAAGGGGGFAWAAIEAVSVFALFFVYPVAFELGARGRTLGKRWTGLRVISADGSPVTFRASVLRNLLRLVDILPTAYLVGAIFIFATRHNQRLGDLAAGTLVVHESRAAAPAPQPLASLPEADPGELPAWDVSGLRAPELAALRRFMERRTSLDAVPRNLLARDLAERLRPAVGGVGAELEPERFLELIATLKRIRT